SNFHVVGDNKEHYSRLKSDWETTTIDREFAPMDLLHARDKCRVIALEGPTGTGKTKAVQRAVDLMEEQFGHKVLLLGLYHRASLTHKGAADFGVRDLSSPPGTFERECGRVRDGLFSCCESIKKNRREWDLWQWSWELRENPRPVVLFLDEITQMAQHLLLAGTPGMRNIRRDAIKALERLIRNPEVTVIAAEAGIGDIELKWLAALSGVQPHLINTTFRRRSELVVGAATADNIDKLQQLCGLTLDQNHQVWISMGQVKTLHSFCSPFTDKFLIHGENSKSEEVAALMADTNTVASQYPLIGYSPAIVSGISYEASTVGIAACVQQAFMGPQDAMQAVARARLAELRIMLAPVSVPGALIGTGETTEVGVRRARGETIDPELRELYQDHMREVDPATLRYSVALEARNNYEALNNEHVLRCRLEDQGYNLCHFDKLVSQADVIVPKAERIKQTKQAELDYRTRLLHEVMTDQKSISQAASEAARETKNGTWIDLAAIDPSHAYGWLLRLRIQDLIAAKTFTTQTSEFLAMATEVQVLNKHEARELRGVLGGRITIPGPDDEVKPTFAKALLRMAGFTVERKLVRSKGTRSYRYEVTTLEVSPLL
ncbi:hypothetical protein, partial [Synechococcus sp. MU1655]|uniref:hypothetical protein n=1 Tax=Synechococcus sp. MU1655 TaxID=2508355 RepID=UPI00202659ED